MYEICRFIAATHPAPPKKRKKPVRNRIIEDYRAPRGWTRGIRESIEKYYEVIRCTCDGAEFLVGGKNVTVTFENHEGSDPGVTSEAFGNERNPHVSVSIYAHVWPTLAETKEKIGKGIHDAVERHKDAIAAQESRIVWNARILGEQHGRNGDPKFDTAWIDHEKADPEEKKKAHETYHAAYDKAREMDQ